MKLSFVLRRWICLLCAAAAVCCARTATAAGSPGTASLGGAATGLAMLSDYAAYNEWDGGECDADYADIEADGQSAQAGLAAPAARGEAPLLLAALDKKSRAAPAMTPAPASLPVAAATRNQWDIRATDRTLNVAMARWAAAAGWQLLWEVPVDYAVEADTTIPGTFEQAVEAVTRSMESAEIPLKAIFYKGNSVLRIVAKGAE
jgi:hypothetical protein